MRLHLLLLWVDVYKRQLGYRKVPVIIRVLSEDDSILSMVDSNLHRERISYSEKAFAYKLKNDVLKRKSGRKKSQVDHKKPRKRSIDIISENWVIAQNKCNVIYH